MGNEKKILSIIICTYNREKLLRQAVKSLVEQVNAHPMCELIIVDNNSSDETAQVAKNFKNKIINLKYIFEAEQGLSSARNRGLKEAKGDYVGYIDDDCIALPDWIATALEVIKQTGPDLFGGGYVPWYESKKPTWFKDAYATKNLGENPRLLEYREFLSGGNFFIKKTLLQDYAGFKSDFGMKGNRVGFGEEVYLQMMLRKKEKDLRIFYHPDLLVTHRVSDKKTNFYQRIEHAYIDGKDWQRIHNLFNKRRNRFRSFLILNWSILSSTISFTFGSLLRDRKIYPFRENYWFEISLKKIRRVGGEIVNTFMV